MPPQVSLAFPFRNEPVSEKSLRSVTSSYPSEVTYVAYCFSEDSYEKQNSGIQVNCTTDT